MDIALVTADLAWEADDDVPLLVAALDQLGISWSAARWDDPEVDWNEFDMAVLKSPWDYTEHHSEFLDWAATTAGATELLNPVEVIRWNSDKHYLADLAAAGLPVVETSYLSPSDLVGSNADRTEVGRAIQAMLPGDDGSGSVVVKPTVSAGSKDTARYSSDQIDDAIAHAMNLLGEGRAVMVQPYLASVEEVGETGLIFFNGEFSHAFRKGALLAQGAAEVDGLFAVEDISSRIPSDSELALARRIVASVLERFPDPVPLYTRVDLLADDSGDPFLLELEMVEPSYFLVTDPEAADRAAGAYEVALNRVRSR